MPHQDKMWGKLTCYGMSNIDKSKPKDGSPAPPPPPPPPAPAPAKKDSFPPATAGLFKKNDPKCAYSHAHIHTNSHDMYLY